MGTSSRDDFSQSVKETLAKRVQLRCSNPECCAATSGPQSDPTKAINVGVAAHISAAASGGPRYDPALTPAQRSGISNAIWLCQNCAKLVDSDPSRYSVDVLRAWKESAEAGARSTVGKACTRTGAEPTVVDKWVTLAYVDSAGISQELAEQGYRTYWSSANNESMRVDLEGWEPALIKQADGSLARLKVRDHPAVGGYIILLKKKESVP